MLDHQKEKVFWWRAHRYGLDASEMGTGKTLPVIELLTDGGKHVVVAPSFLLRNWRNEIRKFAGEEAAIFPDTARITLISQDRMHQDGVYPLFAQARYVAIDEAHGFGNIGSRRSRALHEWLEKSVPERLMLLTGTPLKNRIPELYSLLRLLDLKGTRGFKLAFRTQHVFSSRYCHEVRKRVHGRTFVTYQGARNLQELKDKWLEGIYTRQLLKDLKLVPEVIHQSMEAEAEPVKKDTDEMLEKGWRAMEQFQKPPEAVATAKKLSAISKAKWTAEYAQQLLSSNQEECLVIFSDHVEPCHIIANALGNARVITGATSMEERAQIISDFQEGKVAVVVGTIGACGTGITLTRAKTVIFNDKSYVPAQNVQAVGRLRRIGQKSTVLAIDVCRPGIDEKITAMLLMKEETIALVLSESKPL